MPIWPPPSVAVEPVKVIVEHGSWHGLGPELGIAGIGLLVYDSQVPFCEIVAAHQVKFVRFELKTEGSHWATYIVLNASRPSTSSAGPVGEPPEEQPARLSL